MMRPLHVATVVAASAVLLAACGAGPRAEAASARVGEPDAAHDTLFVADKGVAAQTRVHDTAVVSESGGKLDSTTAAQSAAYDSVLANEMSVSSHTAFAGDEYVDPLCAASATADQQHCLSGYLTTSDLMLERYLQALILRLESEAGVTSGTEPPAVKRLRAAQRAWVTYRDNECRKRTREREGLWAPERARCLIDYSTQRTYELAGVLAERRALPPLDQPAPSAQRSPPTQRPPSTKPMPSKRSHLRKASRHARAHRR